MESNNLSLFLDEANKERAAKNLSNYIRQEKKRIAVRKQIIKSIKILSLTLVCLLIYSSWRLI